MSGAIWPRGVDLGGRECQTGCSRRLTPGPTALALSLVADQLLVGGLQQSCGSAPAVGKTAGIGLARSGDAQVRKAWEPAMGSRAGQVLGSKAQQRDDFTCRDEWIGHDTIVVQ